MEVFVETIAGIECRDDIVEETIEKTMDNKYITKLEKMFTDASDKLTATITTHCEFTKRYIDRLDTLIGAYENMLAMITNQNIFATTQPQLSKPSAPTLANLMGR